MERKGDEVVVIFDSLDVEGFQEWVPIQRLQIKNGDRGLGDIKRDGVVVVAPEARLPAENEGIGDERDQKVEMPKKPGRWDAAYGHLLCSHLVNCPPCR